MQQKEFLGIDIGASGIKGAIVNVKTGKLVSERLRIPTPSPATPNAVAKTFAELVKKFDYKGEIIGCGFPAIVKKGVAHSAANIDKSWIGTDIHKLFAKTTKKQIVASNDADVAGLAELRFGGGKGKDGTVLVITVGTGLGSALFTNGHLIPNTEFGHFYLKGHNKVAEQYASDRVRKKKDLSWKIWATRFDKYLQMVEKLFSPDMIILGGGASKKFEKFADQLHTQAEIVPAELLNNAGIIGAAVFAAQTNKTK